MDLLRLLPLLREIKGVTFASLDAYTKPAPGIRKETTGERVLLYNSRVSGYERLVRRRLSSLGLDPNSFNVGDLPWGLRLPDEPGCVIVHKGVYYLQTILLGAGNERYFDLVGKPVSSYFAAALAGRSRDTDDRVGNSQGLPADRAVRVHTYSVSSITGIRLLGQNIEEAA